MSLSDLAALGSFVSGIAVMVSLVFLGFQMRQNTKAVKASTSQAHSATYMETLAPLVNNAEMANVWRRGLDDFSSLSPDEEVRFLAFASSLFRYYDASRVQWRHGQLDNEHWHTITQQVVSLAHRPGIMAWWKLRRSWHSPDFQHWIESMRTDGGQRDLLFRNAVAQLTSWRHYVPIRSRIAGQLCQRTRCRRHTGFSRFTDASGQPKSASDSVATTSCR
jgi:hypothetical protein